MSGRAGRGPAIQERFKVADAIFAEPTDHDVPKLRPAKAGPLFQRLSADAEIPSRLDAGH